MKLPALRVNHLSRSSLVDVPQCPRCAAVVTSIVAPDEIRAVFVCYRPKCQQHWYHIYLRAGAVEPQLADVFDIDHARLQMALWALPASIDRPKYWQLALARGDVDTYGRLAVRELFAAIARVTTQRIAAARAQS